MAETFGIPSEKQACTLHKYHGTARPGRTVWHHIWPKGWGGPDYKPGAPAGGVWTCDNGHYTIHRILDWFRKQDAKAISAQGGVVVPDTANEVARMKPPFKCSRSELIVARQGYYDWASNGRPTGPGGE
jgi:hypothetical protein